MGKLHYEELLVVEFEDRLLAHLQIAIGVKLRRNESFHFSWRDDPSVGGGRSTVWMHPAIPLRFHYRSRSMPTLNLHWVDALISTANTPSGLLVLPEPPAEPPAGDRPAQNPPARK